MHFMTLLFLAITALFAGVQANPIILAGAQPNNNTIIARDDSVGENCYDGEWENRGSDASPTVDDCEHLFGVIDISTVNYVGYEQEAIMSYGTCILGGNTAWHQGVAAFTGADAKHVIRQSIDLYAFKATDGVQRVGTRGHMTCAPYQGARSTLTTLWWGLY